MEKKKRLFIEFMSDVVARLKTEGHAPAAHVHRSALRSFTAFLDGKEVRITAITPKLLKEYENWLSLRGKSRNTISTYMRALRSTYYRAVGDGLAPFVRGLFSYVYTRIDSPTKRALPQEEVEALLTAKVPKALQKTQACFALMFLLCGMPFIDLSHLRPRDLQGNMLTYSRHKTGQNVHIILCPEAYEWIAKFACTDGSPYLFPILSGDRTNYATALRTLNKHLRKLSVFVLGHSRVSSYTARHSWATIAHEQDISIGVISSGLGHTSIRTTESYLAPLSYEKLKVAHQQVLNAVYRKNRKIVSA